MRPALRPTPVRLLAVMLAAVVLAGPLPAAATPTAAQPAAVAEPSAVDMPPDGMWQVAPVTARPVAVPATRQAAGDPLADDQWAYDQVGAADTWPSDGHGVTVAVIDSGVDVDHPDLTGADILPGIDMVDGTDDAWDDPNGHGTAVTGIIVAQPDNGHGIIGAAPTVTILPIRTFDADGLAPPGLVAASIRAATAADVDIINLSAGSSTSTQATADAIAEATAADILVVVAAGNSGGRVHWPAAHTSTVAVAATGPDGQRAEFSSHGPQLDVAAPGVDILTLAPDGGYVVMSGTSFAAPLTAAAAATLRAVHPTMPLTGLHAALRDATIPPSADAKLGHGIIWPAELAPTRPGTVGTYLATSHRPDGAAVTLTGDLPDGQAQLGVLATGRDWPDTLAATAVAADSPIWMTHPTAGLTADLIGEIGRVLADDATLLVLGGTAAISTTDRARLGAAGITIDVAAGPDRIGTALAAADWAAARRPVTGVVLVSAADWIDAASAGTHAARTGQVLLVTGPDRLDSRVGAWLAGRDMPVTLVGGTAALSRAIEADLADVPAIHRRVAGPDRYTTTTTVATDGPPSDHVVLAPIADPDGWPVGLLAGAVAARLDAPLVGTSRLRPGIAALDHLAAVGPVAVTVVGGVDGSDRMVEAYNAAGVVVADDVVDGSNLTVGLMGRAAKVVAGTLHTCAVTVDGQLWCWGAGESGQAADHGQLAPVPTRLDVGGPRSVVVDVGVSDWSTCAVTDDGQMWCMGRAANGQQADGTVAGWMTPIDVAGLEVDQVVGGSTHMCAVAGGRTQLWCWGAAADGQAGQPTGSSTHTHTPARVHGLPAGQILSAMAGRTNTCVTVDGAGVWCVGGNHRGQQGRAGGGGHVPRHGAAFGDAVTVVGGWDHTCAQDRAGTWRCAGGNYGNQFAATNPGEAATLPVPAGSQVDSDNLHGCMVADGRLACHGSAHLGRLGYPDAAWQQPADPAMFDDEPLAGVTTGDATTCVWSVGGRVWCAGDNRSGQVGVDGGGFGAGLVEVATSQAA